MTVLRLHAQRRRGSALLGALALLALAPAAASAADTLVTTGSPIGPFSQNKQNEPSVAVDPSNPAHAAAGSNDEIDLEACAASDPTTCPFTPGIGVSGIYFSTSGGSSWVQPTYQGLTARHCLGPAPCQPRQGPIGTLPKYDTNGLVSGGDPALVFGPLRGADGRFSWANGSRLYYANLASALAGSSPFRGAEAVYASRTDSFPATTNAQWKDPVLVSKQNSALFSDKEQIWADNAASSPYFGNVYICNVAFRGKGQGNAQGEPLFLARSTDAGDTWDQRQITSATNNAQSGGRQGCAVRTDSRGRVYVIYEGFDKKAQSSAFLQVTSDDGGKTFGRPREIELVNEVGLPDPATGRFSFDGVAGARTSTFPSVDIANGAPSGAGAPNTIALTWPDGPTPSAKTGGSNEQAKVAISTDRGGSYRTVGSASPAGDRPDFPAIAISPDGTDVYVTYTNFLQPFQSTTAKPRLANGVVRQANVTGGTVGAFSDLNRAPTGDARGSSQNGLTAEFLGDYNYAFATNDKGVAVFNDVRRAADCPAIDAYRQVFVNAVTGGTAQARDEDLGEIRADGGDAPSAQTGAPKPPNVQAQCPIAFGNSDIFGGAYADPPP